MGLLTFLLTLPVLGPVNGITFIAEKLAEQGLHELMDETEIQRRLMELELRHEMGEIDFAEYQSQEEELLERLDVVQQLREQRPEGEDLEQ